MTTSSPARRRVSAAFWATTAGSALIAAGVVLDTAVQLSDADPATSGWRVAAFCIALAGVATALLGLPRYGPVRHAVAGVALVGVGVAAFAVLAFTGHHGGLLSAPALSASFLGLLQGMVGLGKLYF